MTDKAIELRRAYYRNWYSKNKQKRKDYIENYWERKAERKKDTNE